MNVLEAIEVNKSHAVAMCSEGGGFTFIFDPGDLKHFNEFTYNEVVSPNWINVDKVEIAVSASKLKKAFLKHCDDTEAFAEFLSDVRSK
jgi:hypothetical protein